MATVHLNRPDVLNALNLELLEELADTVDAAGKDGDVKAEEVLERVKRNYILRRLAKAREVASAVVFLASYAASFITGQPLASAAAIR